MKKIEFERNKENIGKWFFSEEMRCQVKYIGSVANDDTIFIFWDGNSPRILNIEKISEVILQWA